MYSTMYSTLYRHAVPYLRCAFFSSFLKDIFYRRIEVKKLQGFHALTFLTFTNQFEELTRFGTIYSIFQILTTIFGCFTHFFQNSLKAIQKSTKNKLFSLPFQSMCGGPKMYRKIRSSKRHVPFFSIFLSMSTHFRFRSTYDHFLSTTYL